MWLYCCRIWWVFFGFWFFFSYGLWACCLLGLYLWNGVGRLGFIFGHYFYYYFLVKRIWFGWSLVGLSLAYLSLEYRNCWGNCLFLGVYFIIFVIKVVLNSNYYFKCCLGWWWRWSLGFEIWRLFLCLGRWFRNWFFCVDFLVVFERGCFLD